MLTWPQASSTPCFARIRLAATRSSIRPASTGTPEKVRLLAKDALLCLSDDVSTRDVERAKRKSGGVASVMPGFVPGARIEHREIGRDGHAPSRLLSGRATDRTR